MVATQIYERGNKMKFLDIVLAMKVPGKVTKKQWVKLSDSVKRAYVKLHPTSIFAELYKKEQVKRKKAVPVKKSHVKKVTKPLTRAAAPQQSFIQYKESTFKPMSKMTWNKDDGSDIVGGEYKELQVDKRKLPTRRARLVEYRMTDSQTRLACQIFRDLTDNGLKFNGRNDEQLDTMLRKKYGKRWANIAKAYRVLQDDPNSFVNTGLFMYEQPEDIEVNHMAWAVEHDPRNMRLYENTPVELQISYLKANPDKAKYVHNLNKKASKYIIADKQQHVIKPDLIKKEDVKRVVEKNEIVEDNKDKDIVKVEKPATTITPVKEETKKPESVVNTKPYVSILDRVPAPPRPAPTVVKVEQPKKEEVQLTGKTAKINIDTKGKTNEQILVERHHLVDRHLKAGNNVRFDELVEEDWNNILHDKPEAILQIKDAPASLVYNTVKSHKDLIDKLNDKQKAELVKEDGMLLKEIAKPDEETINNAIDSNAAAIQFVKNPTEDQQQRAVINNLFAFRYIKNPSPEVKEIYDNLKEDYDAQKKQGKTMINMYTLSKLQKAKALAKIK
jgi:hypothetical protein